MSCCLQPGPVPAGMDRCGSMERMVRRAGNVKGLVALLYRVCPDLGFKYSEYLKVPETCHFTNVGSVAE